MSKQITDYQLIDHGIEHEQYFQGCGVAFTMFDHVVTGMGDTFAEAIDDALEMIAQSESDVDLASFEAQMKTDEDVEEWSTEPSVSALEAKSDRTHESFDDHHYYVSIRYNLS